MSLRIHPLFIFIVKYSLVSIFFCLVSCSPPKTDTKKETFVPKTPVLDPSRPEENAKRYTDILRTEDRDIMDIINDPSLTAVTHEFGLTHIKTKIFPYKSLVGKADVKPWSSWWYPKRDPSLFDDSKSSGNNDHNHLSTLSKFDLYKRSKVPNAASAAVYERNNYNSNSLSWEGLCDAWSIAALSSLEPKRSVSVPLGGGKKEEITFDIEDLKGLLLKTYEAIDDVSFKYYGQKFTGQEKGWIYPDIFPEQFHRLIEVQLYEKLKPFIIDIDPGVEVWNVPVFKVNYTMSEIPEKPNSVFVRTWIYFADSIKTDDKSFVGTKEVVREYDYVLQGERDSNGDLVVTVGYWVKGPNGSDSRVDHPDFVMIPPDRDHLVRKSWNPEIDNATVDEILSQSF